MHTAEKVGQILHIDVDVFGLVGFEAAMLGAGILCLQIAQVAHVMPTQAAIQPRARDIRVQELPNHGQQIIQRHEQCLAQGDRNGLLCRGQSGLQPVRCVAAVRCPALVHL